MAPLIELKAVCAGYGRNRVLHDVSLRVDAGDFLGIVGPNGSGKSTLLKTMLGLLRPSSGDLVRSSAAGDVGYVPQRDSIDPIYPLTVLDIVLMGAYRRLRPWSRIGPRERDLAMHSLDHVGIADLASRRYSSLSGGQKQRTVIARALVGQPALLAFDEPTNGMDLPAERSTMDLIERLHVDDGITVLMVSHLLNTVVNYAHHIAFVGDGRVRSGSVAEMISAPTLSELYAAPVQVVMLGDRRIVLPDRGSHGEHEVREHVMEGAARCT
ncbi:MAG TPA: metal ABC transporter ATP-binding protein [Chthonomonadales bacterium]|nr:metal ABC transporter ATP-binding protein [Chthonomonadales bacterium]